VLLGDFRGQQVGGDGGEGGEDGGQEDADVTNINWNGQFVQDNVEEAAG
jgi:hypothetical protein